MMNPTNQPNQRETQPTSAAADAQELPLPGRPLIERLGERRRLAHNELIAERDQLRETNKELLAACKAAYALLEKIPLLKTERTRRELGIPEQLRAAIAKASPTPIEPTFTGRTIPATGGPWTGGF